MESKVFDMMWGSFIKFLKNNPTQHWNTNKIMTKVRQGQNPNHYTFFLCVFCWIIVSFTDIHFLTLPIPGSAPSFPPAGFPFPDAAGQLWTNSHRWQPTRRQASWDLCRKDVQDGGLGDPADVHEDRRGGWILVWRHCELNYRLHTCTHTLWCWASKTDPNGCSWAKKESFRSLLWCTSINLLKPPTCSVL